MAYRQPLTAIYLYDEPDAIGLDVADIGGYLASVFPGVEIVPRTDFFTFQFNRFSDQERELLEAETIRQMELARVTDQPVVTPGAPSDDEGPEFVFAADLYQAILRLLIDPAESGADHAHIIFTDAAIGTRESAGGFRLHSIAMGAPSIISVTGMGEALQRPREFEFKRAQVAMFGLDEEALDEIADQFADRTFGPGDPRINEVCKGYALMAAIYRVFGEAFCADRACRLHAAQDQEQMLEIQCGENAGLCDRHREMLDSLTPTG